MAFSTGALAKGDFTRRIDVQVHVSEVGTRGEHLPLGATTRLSFAQVAHRLPADCPLIIESVIPTARIANELDAVCAALETAPAE